MTKTEIDDLKETLSKVITKVDEIKPLVQHLQDSTTEDDMYDEARYITSRINTLNGQLETYALALANWEDSLEDNA